MSKKKYSYSKLIKQVQKILLFFFMLLVHVLNLLLNLENFYM